jgi:hypothetical protein
MDVPMKRISKRDIKRRTVQMRVKTARKASKPKSAPPKRSPAKPTRAKPTRAKSSREKVSAHRGRLRKRGYRLVQMWLPDTRTPEFAEQAHRASLAISNSATEAEDQAWVDSVSWWTSPEVAALEKSDPSTPWWRTDGPSD